VSEPDGAIDLLTLIGRTIDRLQRGIELFEEEKRDAGLEYLACVIQEIDIYLKRADEDPLLLLAGLPPREVNASLTGVKSDISSVIVELKKSAD